jgi:hypothetical protein
MVDYSNKLSGRVNSSAWKSGSRNFPHVFRVGDASGEVAENPVSQAVSRGKPARKTLVAENDRDNGDVIFLPETTSGVGNFGGG